MRSPPSHFSSLRRRFLFFVSQNRVYIHYLLLQAAFLPYLTGLAVYISGGEDAWVLFWFKICITGLILTPIALKAFLESLLEVQKPVHHLLIGFAGLILLLLLWVQPSLIRTGEINLHPLGFFSVEKGPLFPLVALYVLGFSFASIGWFIKSILSVPGGWKQYNFILTGLGLWVVSVLADALISFRAIEIYSIAWLGPVAMVITIGLHMGVAVERNFRNVKEKVRENRILKHKLKYDPLTGLYTRDFFSSILEIEADAWARKPQENSILFIDADNFKGINDRYGHAGGDRILIMIGDVIREHVRRSDIPSRYGGDEFIILLRNCTRDYARILGEKIIGEYRVRLKEMFSDIPEGFSGLSIGIAATSFWANGNRDLIALADEAMYCSKRDGKNRVVVAEAG